MLNCVLPVTARSLPVRAQCLAPLVALCPQTRLHACAQSIVDHTPSAGMEEDDVILQSNDEKTWVSTSKDHGLIHVRGSASTSTKQLRSCSGIAGMLAEELGLTAQHDESLEAAPTDPEEWTCRYSQSQSGQPRQQQFIQAIGGYQPDRKTTQWNATMGIGGPPVRNATHVALLVCCSPTNGMMILHPTNRNGHPLRNMGFCMADSSEDNDFDATMHSPQFIAELFRNTTSNWGQEEWAGGLGDAVERAISDDRPRIRLNLPGGWGSLAVSIVYITEKTLRGLSNWGMNCDPLHWFKRIGDEGWESIRSELMRFIHAQPLSPEPNWLPCEDILDESSPAYLDPILLDGNSRPLVNKEGQFRAVRLDISAPRTPALGAVTKGDVLEALLVAHVTKNGLIGVYRPSPSMRANTDELARIGLLTEIQYSSLDVPFERWEKRFNWMTPDLHASLKRDLQKPPTLVALPHGDNALLRVVFLSDADRCKTTTQTPRLLVLVRPSERRRRPLVGRDRTSR